MTNNWLQEILDKIGMTMPLKDKNNDEETHQINYL